LSLIKKLNTNKIKVFRNKTNQGAFRNKYETVSKCSNEWIYLLDSDNYPFEWAAEKLNLTITGDYVAPVVNDSLTVED
jgi:glycosyltransferase involved in cell wall biosynthesis